MISSILNFEYMMEKWIGSKLGKEYIKAVYCHPAYLIYMQSISRKIPDWMKHKLESRLLGAHVYLWRIRFDVWQN